MNANGETSKLVLSTRRRVRRYRIIASLVLLLGLAGAGTVFWLGSRGPDYSDDPAMTGFDRGAERQMEMLYGKQGALIQEFTNDLKQPGTQALLIIIASAIVAAGCFYLARLLAEEGKEAGADGMPKI